MLERLLGNAGYIMTILYQDFIEMIENDTDDYWKLLRQDSS